MLYQRVIALSLTLLYLGLAPALAACRWQQHDAPSVSIGSHSHSADAHHQDTPPSISCDLRDAYALASSRTAPLDEGLPLAEGYLVLTARDHSSSGPPNWRTILRFPSVSVPVASIRFLSFVSVFRI